jgi:hypothetical protein
MGREAKHHVIIHHLIRIDLFLGKDQLQQQDQDRLRVWGKDQLQQQARDRVLVWVKDQDQTQARVPGKDRVKALVKGQVRAVRDKDLVRARVKDQVQAQGRDRVKGRVKDQAQVQDKDRVKVLAKGQARVVQDKDRAHMDLEVAHIHRIITIIVGVKVGRKLVANKLQLKLKDR